MNTRQQHILKQLIGEHGHITGKQLADLLQVSSRTIRSDLKEIESRFQKENSGARIISLYGQGYYLDVIDEDKFKSFLRTITDKDETMPVEPEDRVQYLVRLFLLSSDYLKIEDLADKIFVSRSTLQNDLKDVKVTLNQFYLELTSRPNYGLKLSGKEKHIRYAISELLFRDTFISLENENQQKWLLPVKQMELIRNIVLKRPKEVQLNLSDIGLNNLVIHIAIAYRRINHEQYVQSNKEEYELKSKREYQVAKRIIKDIEDTFEIEFPAVEISYIAIHLLGSKLFLSKNHTEVANNIDGKIIEIVTKMVNRVEKQMHLGIIEDQELHAAIAIHLKPTIHRYKHQMNIRNPMLEAIKVNYPVAFEAGIIATQVIEEEYKIKVDENEVGYIALHFGAAIERAKFQSKPKRCLIVCTTGLGSSQLLFYKMKAEFGNRLIIVGVTELHNLFQYKDDSIDFIVSTVPLSDSITIPHVVINTLLGDNELSKIENMLNNTSSSVADKYLKEDLIYLNKSFKTPKQVIEFLGNQLINKGYTREGIVETVLAREQAASTSYGNLVAIPHPFEAKSNQTFWTLLTLVDPIDWGGNKVQFICLLHVAKSNKENLDLMYKSLIRFLDNRSIIQDILKAENVKEVLNIIKRM